MQLYIVLMKINVNGTRNLKQKLVLILIFVKILTLKYF